MNAKEMTVWIVGLALLGAVLLSPAGCTMHRHHLIGEALKRGTDPVDAKCALEGDSGQTVCALRAAQGKAVKP